MSREQFANDAQDTLSGSIDSDDMSLTLADASEFPATGNFRLRINDELLLCTARSGNNLTVERAIEGSAPASHSSGASVSQILTVGSLDRGGKDNVPLWGSDAPPLNKLVAHDGSLLTSADFTWVNQGGASLTDHAGSLTLRAPQSGTTSFRLAVRTAPATPYSLVAALQCFVPRDISGGNGNPALGMVFRQSSTGKLHTFGFNSSGTTPMRLAGSDWTNETTFAGTNRLLLTNSVWIQSVQWFKLTDDGTNLTYYVSPDGIEWVELLQHARGAFMTGGPDQIGIQIANHQTSGAFDALLRLLHWSTE